MIPSEEARNPGGDLRWSAIEDRLKKGGRGQFAHTNTHDTGSLTVPNSREAIQLLTNFIFLTPKLHRPPTTIRKGLPPVPSLR